MPITHSVGKAGGNIKSEVRYVQALLNVWREQQKLLALKLDGLVGPKTIGAIEEFQRAKTGFVDGRVDPNGATIKSLEALIEPVSRELKAYSTLALVLSYDPMLEQPQLNTRELLAMIQSISPKQG
jgi:peptidoglycan hydrolase-like protein with peptidoglycan-binding domain